MPYQNCAAADVGLLAIFGTATMYRGEDVNSDVVNDGFEQGMPTWAKSWSPMRPGGGWTRAIWQLGMCRSTLSNDMRSPGLLAPMLTILSLSMT